MTEEEAKTKVCCGPPNVAWGAAGASKTCIGSKCMAWRWRHAEFEAARDTYEDSFNIAGINSREEPKLRGHCGFAGSPE